MLFRPDDQPEQSYSERGFFKAASNGALRELAAMEETDERAALKRSSISSTRPHPNDARQGRVSGLRYRPDKGASGAFSFAAPFGGSWWWRTRPARGCSGRAANCPPQGRRAIPRCFVDSGVACGGYFARDRLSFQPRRAWQEDNRRFVIRDEAGRSAHGRRGLDDVLAGGFARGRLFLWREAPVRSPPATRLKESCT